MRDRQAWSPSGDGALLFDFLPDDHSRQTHSFQQALAAMEQYATEQLPLRILDLGCGTGNSAGRFRACARQIFWIGMDLLESPEVNTRVHNDFPLCTYDGLHIPLRSGSIDLVYSHQVFEHVRYPGVVLSEVIRVLRDGGCLVGSTSHLEPFHSSSLWNFTPYGFCSLLRDAGFAGITVRPGIDGASLIVRRLLALARAGRIFDIFFTRESPLNASLELLLRLLRTDVRRRNAVKLLFAGHFCFTAVKRHAPEAVITPGIAVHS